MPIVSHRLERRANLWLRSYNRCKAGSIMSVEGLVALWEAYEQRRAERAA
jgi:hypothetical protein